MTVKLSDRVRPNSEVAAWVHKEILAMENTIAEQAREIERLNSDYNEACEDAMCVARELERQKMNCLNLLQQLEDLKAQHEQDAQTIKVLQAMARQLKAQPIGVVLPERWSVPRPIWKDVRQPYGDPLNKSDIEAAEKFNLALDEVARLNSSPVSAGEPVYQFQCREIGEGDWEPCDHSRYMYCQKSPEMDTRVVQVQALSAPNHSERVPELSSFVAFADALGLDLRQSDDQWNSALALYEKFIAAYPQPSAALSAPSHGEQVRDGWRLVPERMHLSREAIESITAHCGDGQEDSGYGPYSDGVLWVGEIEEEDGTKTYGLHIATADYPEQGSTTLVELAAAPSAGSQKGGE